MNFKIVDRTVSQQHKNNTVLWIWKIVKYYLFIF